MDEHESYQAHNDDPDVDPFDLLHNHVDSGLITDLPRTIEQYSELLDLAHRFNDYRKKLAQGFNEIFGDALSPRTDLSEDERNKLDAYQEIEAIRIEYCLDRYNEFYGQSVNLMDCHRQAGTIRECVKAILSLYVPHVPL